MASRERLSRAHLIAHTERFPPWIVGTVFRRAVAYKADWREIRGMQPGFRRRILIEPMPGCVSAELEDDYHRMVVRLDHADGVVDIVSSEMKRWPWTLCPGAVDRLAETFAGHRLADFTRLGEKTQNCTHLYDLAVFAAAHADGVDAVAYDILVTDPVDGIREAILWRDGACALEWRLAGDRFLAPADLAGGRLGELGDWVAAQDKAGAEAARLLRWAAILAYGRGMDIPAGIPATTFPGGSCYNFQAERAAESTRRPGADTDFSAPQREPMSDRAAAFAIDIALGSTRAGRSA